MGVNRRRKARIDAKLVEAERDFLQDVTDGAKLLGWAVYHTHDSRHSAAGFPDLILLRPPRQVVAELKVGDHQPTAEQTAWLDTFRACGGEAYVWWPADWPAIRLVLERRGHYETVGRGKTAAGERRGTPADRRRARATRT